MPYRSTKTYGHEVGLSACFRQWRATHSHCRFLHGYALSITLTFEADELDHRNWVQDFGGLKEIKELLVRTFDHKTVVALDDPWIDHFYELKNQGVIDLVTMEAVGCEAFAKHVFEQVEAWLVKQAADDLLDEPRVTLAAVEVREHGANSALYVRPTPPVNQGSVVEVEYQGASTQEILDAYARLGIPPSSAI